jgi:hypothetical protein
LNAAALTDNHLQSTDLEDEISTMSVFTGISQPFPQLRKAGAYLTLRGARQINK